MLAANVCAADILAEHGHPCLYRIHEGPTLEKLEVLRTYLRLTGLVLGGGEKPSTKDYARLAEQISQRPDAPVLETMLLRSMQQAVYSPDNLGHFGLAYEAYTHFTSPIRRYPDLLVHRAIKAILQSRKYKPAAKWKELGVQCSMTERRADDATRDVEAWLKCYYMRDKVGEEFSGKISAVTSFGVFVLLDDIYVEGLLHISELGRDYFHYRQETHSIEGEKSGVSYRLGDRLTVRVARADLESAQIDFVMAKPEGKEAAGGAPSRPAGRQNERSRSSSPAKPAPSKPAAGRAQATRAAAPKPAAAGKPAMAPAVTKPATPPATTPDANQPKPAPRSRRPRTPKA